MVMYTILSIGFVLLASLLFCVNLLPYCYSWITSNYALSIASLLLILSNFTVYVCMIIIYFLIPSELVDMFIIKITNLFRKVFSESIAEVESNIRKTFHIKFLYEVPEISIRIWHPHGIGSASQAVHNVHLIDPSVSRARGVCHSVFHYIPIISNIVRINKLIPSDYETIKRVVKNESIIISIGGVDEMGRSKPKQLELVIRKRKGIFKIALETGTPIVPVLTYGENELFPETDNKILLSINKYMYDTFRLRSPYPSLESLQNWLKLTTQPLDPIYTYTGRPIYVKKIENPTIRQIDIVRRIYIQRVRELFKETNNGEYTLKIV